ncbi:MAG: hypothetical protein NTW99_15180 [Chloroflexi bacterium]|nr:hypothetical protein [Chloroflexota bacterium]
MDNNFLSRIGTFFILVGCGLLILFIGSVFARELSILYLLLTAAALFLGYVFRRAAPGTHAVLWHPQRKPALPPTP